MNAGAHVAMPPTAALRRLADFLRESGSTLSIRDAATEAINQWIATARGQYPAVQPIPARGYQWKQLFLPSGSQLRMRFDGENYYAHVQGDALVYQGQPVSPRQMTIAVSGSGHNAWRELAVLLPGETKWKPASLLRRECDQRPPPRLVPPGEAMAAAAACMNETLKAALALVEHANAQLLPHPERRVERHRRAQDFMEDDCKLD